MEQVLNGKQAEIDQLLLEQQKQEAAARCAQAVEELRSLSVEIDEIGQQMVAKFHQVKRMASEFNQDYKIAHPIPVGQGAGWLPTDLVAFRYISLPKLIEKPNERFEIDAYLVNILQEEEDVVRSARAAAEAQASAHATAQGEQQRRQLELMRLEERRKNLLVSLDAKRQELSSLEAEKAKWANNPHLKFDRIDAGINQKTIEAEEIAKQLDEVTADIERG